MNIGILDIDYKGFPNFALMKIAGYHKAKGNSVEWAEPLFGNYDLVYKSKIFTFSEDQYEGLLNCPIEEGGTGYDIKKQLAPEIENFTALDYTIYPNCNFSVQFLSRGCIRHCPFCLVHDKEGYIRPVEPAQLNPKGEWIEVLDNNFFANPDWKAAVKYLNDTKQPINLHGVDVRIMDEEQAFYLNKMKLKNGNIHIAWDLPKVDLQEKLLEVTKYIKPRKLTCYVLVGFNSTPDQDLYRLETLKELGIKPFVQPYRDFQNQRQPSQYELDLARWANRLELFKTMDFQDFQPRKGFKCEEYFK